MSNYVADLDFVEFVDFELDIANILSIKTTICFYCDILASINVFATQKDGLRTSDRVK